MKYGGRMKGGQVTYIWEIAWKI